MLICSFFFLQVTFGYNETSKGVERMQKLPESSRVHTHQQRLDPPTSEPTTKCSLPLQIYENISLFRHPEGLGYLPMEDQNGHDDNSRIYINPLPGIKSERTSGNTCRKHTSKPMTYKNTESCTNSVSPCVSRDPCESTEEKSRALWFGLDLSGINQH